MHAAQLELDSRSVLAVNHVTFFLRLSACFLCTSGLYQVRVSFSHSNNVKERKKTFKVLRCELMKSIGLPVARVLRNCRGGADQAQIDEISISDAFFVDYQARNFNILHASIK